MFARLTIVLTLLTTLVALLGGARYCLDALQHLRQHKKQTGRWLSILVLWAIPTIAEATTYWVSPTGAAANLAACSGSTPLSGASACTPQQAFDGAGAGDVVNFRGGTYTTPARNFGDGYNAYYMVANSGTAGNYITFQAYTGETPLFNGTSGGTGDIAAYDGNADGCKIMGVDLAHSYVIFDGFSYQCDSGVTRAGVTIGGNGDNQGEGVYTCHDVIYRNLTINGGSTVNAHTGNQDGIRIESSYNITIANNTIYNFRQATDWPNTAGIKMYHTQGVTIEHNHIYNASAAIYPKSGSNTLTIRYNWIHDNGFGIHIVAELYKHNIVNVYHNIIAHSSENSLEVSCAADAFDGRCTDVAVYNNTVYTTATAPGNPVIIAGLGGAETGISRYSIYNNIIHGIGLDYTGAEMRTGYDATDGLTIWDYNNYSSTINVRVSGTNYDTIAGLRAVTAYNLTSGNHNMHSIAAAPTFVNTSGSLSVTTDFALTAASPGYRAGNDGADMGANVSLVGPTTTSVSESLAFFLRGLSWIHWGLTVGGGAFQGLMTCLYLWRRRSKIAWGMLRCWQVTVALPKVLFWRARYRRAVRRWQQAAPCMVTYQGMTLVGERKDGVWQHWSN